MVLWIILGPSFPDCGSPVREHLKQAQAFAIGALGGCHWWLTWCQPPFPLSRPENSPITCSRP